MICCYSNKANLRWLGSMHMYKKFRGRDKVKRITIWILQLQQKNRGGRQASYCPHLPSSKSLIIHLQSEALGTGFPKWERQPKLLTDPAHDLVHLACHFSNVFIYPFHLFGFFFLMQHWQSLDLSAIVMRKHTRKIAFLGRQICESKCQNADGQLEHSDASGWLWVT